MKKIVILNAILLGLFFAQISVNAEDGVIKSVGKATKNAAEKTVETTKDIVDTTVDGTKNIAGKTVKTTKKVANKTAEGTKNLTKKTVETTKDIVDTTVDGTKRVTKKTVDVTKNAAKKTAETTKNLKDKTVENTKDIIEDITLQDVTEETLKQHASIKKLKNEKKELKSAYNSRIKDTKAKIKLMKQSTVSEVVKQDKIYSYEKQILDLEQQRDSAMKKYDARIKEIREQSQ